MGQKGAQITPELLFDSETHFTDNDLSISNNLQKWVHVLTAIPVRLIHVIQALVQMFRRLVHGWGNHEKDQQG